MSYIIRKSTKEDAQAICEVHVNSWKETYAGLMPDSVMSTLKVDDKRIKMWEKMASNEGNFQTYVAIIDDKIVGFSGFGQARDGGDNSVGEIGGMYLLKAYQKKGIGRALFNTAIDGLKKRGLKSMYVNVLKGNEAIKFYEHMGGVFQSESIESYDGEDRTIIRYFWDKI